VRYACRVSGITDLAVPHLDTLARTGLPTLKVCVGYRMPDGTVTREFPVGLKALSQVEPVYEELPNWEWSEALGTAKSFEELPEGARRYVMLIEEVTGVRVSILGVGSERTQAIYRSSIF